MRRDDLVVIVERIFLVPAIRLSDHLWRVREFGQLVG